MNYKKKLEEQERQNKLKAESDRINQAREHGVIPEALPDPNIMDAAEIMVRELLPAGHAPDEVYTRIKMVFKLTEAQATAIIEHVRLGGTPEWRESFCYFAGTGSKKTLQVDELSFWQKFLHGLGFRRYMPGEVDEGFILVQVIDNIIYRRNMGQVKGIVFDILQRLPVQVTIPPNHTIDPCWRQDIQRAVIKNERGLFTMGKAEFLPDLDKNILRDGARESYFVYRNGWVEVTRSGASQLRPHKDLPGLVWQDQIIDRDYYPESAPGISMAQQFIYLISGKDDERAEALHTAIGYLLHRFKSPSLNKAVILMDEQVSSLPNGGTGKSLIGQMVNQMRQTLLIDGRAFRPDKSFLFQRYKDYHSVINFDDVHQWFDLGFVYVTLTQGLTVEKKGKEEIMTKFSETPKVLVSTNFVVQGQGQSSLRRRADYEISPYFSSNWQPVNEFGKQFFIDWTPEEWSSFDKFMHNCIFEFLNKGLLVPHSLNRDLRALIQLTSPDFPDFMKGYLDPILLENGIKRVPKQHIYKEWLAFAGWSEKDLSEKRWKKWLEAWSNYSGHTICEGRTRALGSDQTAQRFWDFNIVPDIVPDIVPNIENAVTNSQPDDLLPF